MNIAATIPPEGLNAVYDIVGDVAPLPQRTLSINSDVIPPEGSWTQ